MWNDFFFALRSLRRAPGFAAVAVLTLALGIGANTAIFSLLYQVLLRSLPVSHPEQLVIFHSDGPQPGSATSDNNETVFAYPIYKELRDGNQSFSGVIARCGAPVSLALGNRTDRASAELVSGNFFNVLGVQPALGRLFTSQDDVTIGAHPVVVLDYGYWQSHFGGASSALGAKVLVNGAPMTVIGVAPRDFRGVLAGESRDIYLPVAERSVAVPSFKEFDDRNYRFLTIVGRLRDGIAIPQAQSAMQGLYKRTLEEDVAGTMRNPRTRRQYLAKVLEFNPASQGLNTLSKQWRKPLLVLMAMVGLLLMIACANVANLLIARATGRQKEIAVRLALGASRFVLVRQLMVESLVVSFCGGALGLVFSAAIAAGLLRLLPEGETGGWLSADVNWTILAFGVGLSFLTGILFGLVPALQASRPDLAPVLKEQASNSSGTASQARLRKLLVVAQFSVSLVLLTGAALFARSFMNLTALSPGFHPENLLTFSLEPALSGYNKERSDGFYRELHDRLAALPGVESVSVAMAGPFSNSISATNVKVEGYQSSDAEDEVVHVGMIGPSYFQTLATPLQAGREFRESDVPKSRQVVVINEAFAKHFFPGRDPVGRHIGDKFEIEVVGVVANSQDTSLRETPTPFMYFPYFQSSQVMRMRFYIRTRKDDAGLVAIIRGMVHSIDASLPVFNVNSMTVQVANSIYTDRLVAALASAFGVLALVLAAIGLYGVIAYSVLRRRNEIGIRMAIGAQAADVLRLVMNEVVVLALAGVAIGIPLAYVVARAMESQLFGVKANDPLTLAAGPLTLLVVALAAGLIPALRALRIDPLQALRYE